MIRKTDKPILLAPAGGEEAFLAALAAGADAIYLGGSGYNARAFAKNFDEETLARCITLAHARGVQVHVTMNTLLSDRELEGALAWATRVWHAGADAIICADLGLIRLLREHLPDMPLHASTQLSVHSSAGAEELSDLGFEVVVAAREVDRDNLTAMCRRAPTEIESFVHGALCVSHSGQCLFSSLVGGRSGNRGECAQPCRLPFQNGYALSLKDMSLASHITDVVDAGVGCLKIEGRMKSPAYVWGVAKIYRQLLDENRNADNAEKDALARIFSRDGHTDGYFTKQLADMTGVRREEDKADSRRMEEDVPPPAPIPLCAVCRIVTGEKISLTLRTPYGKEATATGDLPEAARSAPMTRAGVCERLAKMGGTPYVLSPDNIELTLGEGLNVSPAALNVLRRSAVEGLTTLGREEILPPTVAAESGFEEGPELTALFMRGDVWDTLPQNDKDLFDIAFVPLWEYEKLNAPPRGVWLPPVIFDDEEGDVLAQLRRAKNGGATHALCGNPAQVRYAREAGLVPLGDFRLNITNAYAAAYWKRHGVADAVLSPELTAPQMRDIGGRAVVYGRIPLMLTERCYASRRGTPTGCREACATAGLTDRYGVTFPILRVPRHRNLILNSLPTYMGDRKGDIPPCVRAHMIFTTESPRECREVIHAWRQGVGLPLETRRFAKPTVSASRHVDKEKPRKQGTTLPDRAKPNASRNHRKHKFNRSHKGENA